MSPSRINGGSPPTPVPSTAPADSNENASSIDGSAVPRTGLPGTHRDEVTTGGLRDPGANVENAGTRAMNEVLDPSRSVGSGGPRTPRFHLSPEVRNLVSTASDEYLLSVVADWANDIDSLVGIA